MRAPFGETLRADAQSAPRVCYALFWGALRHLLRKDLPQSAFGRLGEAAPLIYSFFPPPALFVFPPPSLLPFPLPLFFFFPSPAADRNEER